MLVTLSQAAHLLAQGQLVAIPTETVYGLAADAQNDEALTLLYQTKGRPSEHPVILHVAGVEMCRPFVGPIAPAALLLMEAFWPGPLTLLLPKTPLVSPRITGGRALVGVRAPAAAVTLDLLRTLDRPLVAPSANRFGHISPTTAAHVEDEFEGRVAVLDGGPCEVGLESTIVAVEDDRLVILRPGQLSLERLTQVAGLPIVWPDHPVQGVPGALKSHYAPSQPTTLMSTAELAGADVSQAAILAFSEGSWPEAVTVVRMPGQSVDYARELYQALRQAEASACSRIFVELPPTDPEWRAVHDRLQRASSR